MAGPSFISISAVLLLFFCVVKCSLQFRNTKHLPSKKFGELRTDEIIKFYGYPGEEHKVLTEDGYILTNFRIAKPGGYPILLLHGLGAASDCWLLIDRNLPFHLWERGYDVWFWNARGNMYSTEHVNLTYNSNKFFKFSMHELGIYDTTASIDYILNVTGHKDVITIGHSMGTTNVLIAASMRPEYQAKVRLNVIWAQNVFIGQLVLKGVAETLYSNYMRYSNIDDDESFGKRAKPISWNSVKNVQTLIFDTVAYLCAPGSMFLIDGICYLGMELASGYGSKQTVIDGMFKMVTKYPSGSSVNVIKQEIQNMRADEFKPLSYGRKENLLRYGTVEPTPYPIGKVTIPHAIYYGCCNDHLSHVRDTYKLKNRLPNVVKFYSVPYKKFNHGDFLWAKDIYKLLYKDTLMLIDSFTPAKYKSRIPIV